MFRAFFIAAAVALVVGLTTIGTTQAEPNGRDATGASERRLSDAEIKKILIAESIEEYPGSCPCPYSRARNGSRCGKRSAYSRPGGEAPLCSHD